MIKKILFSTLFMMIGYSSFGQSGQYIVILNSMYCSDFTGIINWTQDPKIIIIDPSGNINETNLSPANSTEDVLGHVAEFNATVSDIMSNGYTIKSDGVGASSYMAYFLAISQSANMGWSDGPCPGTGGAVYGVTLVPCCTPP